MELDLDQAERAAICAARGAGDLLRRVWATNGQKEASFIHHKSATDLVTDADHAAEKLIISTLSEWTPSCSFLCEESGATTNAGGGGGKGRWIVDPLDGTTSFAHGHPHFSVSIALEVEGIVVLGVVYGVVLDEV
jgi:myo-inositol-1(or 4)-monophosphatase